METNKREFEYEAKGEIVAFWILAAIVGSAGMWTAGGWVAVVVGWVMMVGLIGTLAGAVIGGQWAGRTIGRYLDRRAERRGS